MTQKNNTNYNDGDDDGNYGRDDNGNEDGNNNKNSASALPMLLSRRGFSGGGDVQGGSGWY